MSEIESKLISLDKKISDLNEKYENGKNSIETLNIELKDHVEKTVSNAIESRKKEVLRQFQWWSGGIITMFSIFLYIGFTKDEFLNNVRETIIPTSHIVKNLSSERQSSKDFKVNILSELGVEKISSYETAKNGIESTVWEAITTKDEERIKKFLDESMLDNAIIDNYKETVVNLIFSKKPSLTQKKRETILEVGSVEKGVVIGHYKNQGKALTACNKIFDQSRKAVIIYFPGPNNLDDPGSLDMPWVKCPKDYFEMTVKLRISNVVIKDILVVGVERPKFENKDKKIKGVRARVTSAVAKEFLKKGIDLGNHITDGKISVEKIF